MKRLNDSEFVESIVRRLDQHAAELEEAELEQLSVARNKALSTLASPSNDTLLESIHSQLKNSEALPADIENRLNHIRHQAMAKHPARAFTIKNFVHQCWLGLSEKGFAAGGMIATACVTVTVVSLLYSSNESSSVMPIDSDIGLIASNEELELYENLDFYLWLAENELLN